jgi:ribosomal protein S27AE
MYVTSQSTLTAYREIKMSIKVCPRCKGFGQVMSSHIHRGMPGLCFLCHGKGTVDPKVREAEIHIILNWDGTRVQYCPWVKGIEYIETGE